MVDKIMYIPNDDTQNYPFCTLQSVDKLTLNLMNRRNKIQLKFPKWVNELENAIINFGD